MRNDAQSVYLSVACSNVGKDFARAVFSCFWGPNHQGNEVLQVPGEQNDSRGSVAAVVRVLQVSPSSQRLHIYSSSQYAIRAFVFGAPGYSARGWACKNADLLQVGVHFYSCEQQRSNLDGSLPSYPTAMPRRHNS